MAMGTAAPSLQNLPDEDDWVRDPNAFFQGTVKTVKRVKTLPLPGAGQETSYSFKKADILAGITVTFDGQITVAGAAATTRVGWPYAVLKRVQLSVNGSSDLFNVNGVDLHVRRHVVNPSFGGGSDVFPSKIGGGDALAVGTYDCKITCEIPVATDPSTLIAALYLAHTGTNVELKLTQADAADLAVGGGATVTLSGNFIVETTTYSIPIMGGKIVLPDLTRLHGMVAVPETFTSIGEQRMVLARTNGQLLRLFVSGQSDTNVPLQFKASAPAANRVDRIGLEYGVNTRPQVWDPAYRLAVKNSEQYGQPVPYDRVVFDQVKENPTRDAIHIAALSELATIVEVGPSVAVVAGKIRPVQEVLYTP